MSLPEDTKAPEYPPDRFLPGDYVEIRYPKDPDRLKEIRRRSGRRKAPLIGVVIARMTEKYEPEVYWVGFENAAFTRLAREFGQDERFFTEDSFHADELVLQSRKRSLTT